MEDKRSTDRWHVGKEIPIAVILGLAVQTGGLIWFAATQTAKLDNLTVLMSEFRAAQYTQADARRDFELATSRHNENRRRIEALENSRKFSEQ
mgnify:CR=1 FL=1